MSLDPRIRILPPRVFLDRAGFQRLFGEDGYLEFGEAVGTQGGFLSRQRLSVSTALGRIDDLPIHGPLASHCGAELPASLCARLGCEAPVRQSGDYEGCPSLTLIGPAGHLHLEEGLLVPMRRLCLTPENARRLGLLQGDAVLCLARSHRRTDWREATRDTIFSDVEVSVGTDYDLELHLDRDDAAAAGLRCGDRASLLNLSRLHQDRPELWLPVGRLVGEADVQRAREKGLRIRVTKGMILTPAAREKGREFGVLDFD